MYYNFPSNSTFQSIQKSYFQLTNDQDFISFIQKIWNSVCAKIMIDENYEITNYYKDVKQKIERHHFGHQELDIRDSILTKINIFCFENHFYASIDTRNIQIRDYLIKHFKLEEFIYYENDEKPDDISSLEWNKRALIYNDFQNGICLDIVYYKNYKFDFYPNVKNS